MKKVLIILGMILLCSCAVRPTMEEVEEHTADCVNSILTEHNNDKFYTRLDNYYLEEELDDLTYKGGLQATVFIWRQKGKIGKNRIIYTVTELDSIQFHKTVIVKYSNRRYDKFSILMKENKK